MLIEVGTLLTLTSSIANIAAIFALDGLEPAFVAPLYDRSLTSDLFIVLHHRRRCLCHGITLYTSQLEEQLTLKGSQQSTQKNHHTTRSKASESPQNVPSTTKPLQSVACPPVVAPLEKEPPTRKRTGRKLTLTPFKGAVGIWESWPRRRTWLVGSVMRVDIQ